ncbi:MAG: hypothetical protein BRD23_03295 [Halobacteriales archaeon SW_9_67_25]|nr:MAG: hypothetical protein BRD23_03295 [Halobacteriales archaeon SW_9_67_25]
MIVVATADFELYHELVTALRERGVEFTTVEPDDGVPYLGTGTRGMGDVLAAVNIARIEGERVDEPVVTRNVDEFPRAPVRVSPY